MTEMVILDHKLGHLPNVSGCCVLSIKRHGKSLLFCLDTGLTLYLHLRMTGRLLWRGHEDDLPAHSRFMIRFPHGSLVCADPRRFATLSCCSPRKRTAVIPDPLKTLNASVLEEAARNRKASIKSFLLDQSAIAGIGNIYVCEMLHKAAVSPWRKAGSLSPGEWRMVARAGLNILRKATACRGTSISDWCDLHGEKGEYQHYLAVYNREDLPCPRCGEKIRRSIISGRGTWYCAACQR